MATDHWIARTERDRERVFRLRYECYLNKGPIPFNPGERFRDAFNDEPNCFSFLMGQPEGAPAATVRITVVRPEAGWHGEMTGNSLAC